MTTSNIRRWLPALGAAAVAVSLAACDQREDERTIGQQIDSAVAQAQRKTEAMKDDVKVAANEPMSETSMKVKDASITTAINLQLARDDKLSALKIDVDTQDGRVRLNGTAPDAASRDRATTLARGVQGVVSVDNQLTVAPPR